MGGSGIFNAFEKDRLTEKCKLSFPEKGTLEEIGMRQGKPFCYWPASALSGSAWGIRLQDHYHDSFVHVSLSRTDGFFFVKECTSWNFYEGEVRNDQEYRELA